ncbi:hypothetical protein ALC60_03742 [Trachymyrmex zeteki]|uniref:N-acetyltransferase domain-containing protein n=1 Tax=Mycetomoellerius zeteki TaxID=64791 RepID=A0A151XA27_9HYME|nr:hypothetical protein ALC60_03742 [Trachymyrmex zeteki]
MRVKPLGQSPKVWQVIEKKNKDGKLMKFTIQEIPEDRYEDAIQHMCTYFLADEPTCQCLNLSLSLSLSQIIFIFRMIPKEKKLFIFYYNYSLYLFHVTFYSILFVDAKNDPLFLHDINVLWRTLLPEGISVAAFIDNPNGSKSIIAGLNVLSVDVKNQKDKLSDYQFKSEKLKNTYEILNKTKLVYERYDVDKHIYAVGLSVEPDYRGYGLSKELLKVRDLIGSAYGVPATATAFTSMISQKSAAGAGFEEFLTTNFADVVDKDGKEYFPNINSKAFKIMGKRINTAQ